MFGAHDPSEALLKLKLARKRPWYRYVRNPNLLHYIICNCGLLDLWGPPYIKCKVFQSGLSKFLGCQTLLSPPLNTLSHIIKCEWYTKGVAVTEKVCTKFDWILQCSTIFTCATFQNQSQFTSRYRKKYFRGERFTTCGWLFYVDLISLLIIIIIIIELTHSKTILENYLKNKPQPAALDIENLSWYSY